MYNPIYNRFLLINGTDPRGPSHQAMFLVPDRMTSDVYDDVTHLFRPGQTLGPQSDSGGGA